MTLRPLRVLALAALTTTALAGCADADTTAPEAPAAETTTAGSAEQEQPQPSSGQGHGSHDDHSSHGGSGGHEGHDHPADGGPPPAGIETEDDATYPVGTTVRVTADHMPGMDGAEATIVGAFDTETYAVSYTPTDGGPEVTDHKWVVQEELDAPHDDELAPGDTAVMNAEHMAGMKGATATIDSVTEETVYMVDVQGTDGSRMTNHKWVVESEIEPLN